MEKIHVKMNVNGKEVDLLTEPRTLLIHALREELGITGPHVGCSSSHCGACTVDKNGMSVKSCTVFAAQANGAQITTIEGLGSPDGLQVLQEMFKEHHGLQCGYCTPGMITEPIACFRKIRTRRKKRSVLASRKPAAAPGTRTSSRPFLRPPRK